MFLSVHRIPAPDTLRLVGAGKPIASAELPVAIRAREIQIQQNSRVGPVIADEIADKIVEHVLPALAEHSMLIG